MLLLNFIFRISLLRCFINKTHSSNDRNNIQKLQVDNQNVWVGEGMNLESVYENNCIPNEIWKLYPDDGIAKKKKPIEGHTTNDGYQIQRGWGWEAERI